MLVRGNSLPASMSQYLIDQIANTPNVDVPVQTEVAEAHGTERLESLTLSRCIAAETRTVPAAALFLFIGTPCLTPNWLPASSSATTPVSSSPARIVRDGKKPQGWRLRRDPYLLETGVPVVLPPATSAKAPCAASPPPSAKARCGEFGASVSKDGLS